MLKVYFTDSKAPSRKNEVLGSRSLTNSIQSRCIAGDPSARNGPKDDRFLGISQLGTLQNVDGQK